MLSFQNLTVLKQEYKDNQKFINWIYIYKKGYNRFYIIFTIFIIIMDVVVFGIIFGIWKNYEDDSFQSLSLIDDSWGFERQTLRIINFYHQMIFTNQTLENISDDYFADNNYSAIENFLIVLNSYNQLRRAKGESKLFKSYKDYCGYSCQSLFDFMETVDNNSWITTLIEIENTYRKSHNSLKQNFFEIDPILEKFPFYSADSSTWVQVAISGSILTEDLQSVTISDGSIHRQGNIQHLPKEATDTMVSTVEKYGYNFQELCADYKKRLRYNIDVLLNWESNYVYKGPKQFVSNRLF